MSQHSRAIFTLMVFFMLLGTVQVGEKKEDGAPAASVTPVINIIFQSDVVEEEVAEKLADLFHNGRTFYYTGGKVGKEAQEPPHFIRYKEVDWKDLEKINV